MNAQLARWLTALPAGLGARRGNEFTKFLEEQPATLAAILDVIGSTGPRCGVATPWDVTGDRPTPAEWPPLAIR